MSRGQGNTVFLIIIVLVAATVGLNYIQHLNSPTEAEAEQQAQLAEEKAMEQAAKVSHPAPPPTPPPAPRAPAAAAPTLVNAPSDLIIGNPKNKNVVALGYTVDAGTERSPDELNRVAQTVEDWAKTHPKYTVKIVCLDLPKDQLSDPADQNLPLGISVNGESVSGCDTNPGAGIFTVSLAQDVLAAVKQ